MDPSDQEARRQRRRQTWTVQELDDAPVPDTDSPIDRLRRLEALRRAGSTLRGETYPEPSTREERQAWPWSRIG